MSLHENPLKTEFVSHSPADLMDISLITFQSQTFGELISLVQLPRVRVLEVGYEHLTPQEGLYLFMVFYAHSGILYLHVSYPSKCGDPLLWSCSFSGLF